MQLLKRVNFWSIFCFWKYSLLIIVTYMVDDPTKILHYFIGGDSLLAGMNGPEPRYQEKWEYIPWGISPLCFSSTRFIVGLCLLIRTIFWPRLRGNKTVHRQDNSLTRVLKTVHRQIWRQFTDTFKDSSSTLFYHVIDTWLENIIDYCEEYKIYQVIT